MNKFATEFVRAIPRIGFAIAATVCALNAVAVLIAQENGEYVFGSMVAAATFGLFTIAASAFSEER